MIRRSTRATATGDGPTLTSECRRDQPARPGRRGAAAASARARRCGTGSTGCCRATTSAWCPGPGTEAGESRPYVAGDDVRRMDWPVTARTTQPHVRQTIADRELETWLAVDLSPSLDFGTALGEKRELVLAAITAVVHLTGRGGNRVGAIVTTGEQTYRIPARAGVAHARHLIARIAATPRASSAGRGELRAALEQLRRPPRRRGLVVVDLRLPRRAGLGASAAGAVRAPPAARGRGARPARARTARRRADHVHRPRDRRAARGADVERRAARPLRRRGPRPSGPRSRPRCATPAPPTCSCAPTAIGWPTSSGSRSPVGAGAPSRPPRPRAAQPAAQGVG